MTAYAGLPEPFSPLPSYVSSAELEELLVAALTGSTVEATIRVRALTEIAASSTSLLCATSAALERLGER